MSTDLRRYARQTNIRLLAGFLLILFLVGDGLIYYLYGQGAAVIGLVCLFAGVAPLVLIGLILFGMELMVKRERDR